MWMIYQNGPWLLMIREPPLIIRSLKCVFFEREYVKPSGSPYHIFVPENALDKSKLSYWYKWQTECEKLCSAGVIIENNLTSRTDSAQLSCQSQLSGFLMRTVGKQLGLVGVGTIGCSQLRLSWEGIWHLNPAPSFRQAPWTRELLCYIQPPVQ